MKTITTLLLALALLLTGCASAQVGDVRLTARGKSSAESCVGEGAEKRCVRVKGGEISQIFGDVLLAPVRIIGGMLGGAAGAVLPPAPSE